LGHGFKLPINKRRDCRHGRSRVRRCAGPNLGVYNVNGGGAEAFRPDVGHWAIEGFDGTQATNAEGDALALKTT
jgi:hypothetical protein